MDRYRHTGISESFQQMEENIESFWTSLSSTWFEMFVIFCYWIHILLLIMFQNHPRNNSMCDENSESGVTRQKRNQNGILKHESGLSILWLRSLGIFHIQNNHLQKLVRLELGKRKES